MNRCLKHGWTTPEGMRCPDCLWDDASSSHGCRASHHAASLKLIDQMLYNCLELMKTNAERKAVLCAARDENYWKALKVARAFHLKPEE